MKPTGLARSIERTAGSRYTVEFEVSDGATRWVSYWIEVVDLVPGRRGRLIQTVGGGDPVCGADTGLCLTADRPLTHTDDLPLRDVAAASCRRKHHEDAYHP
jgi:hypothetical protein